MFRLAYRHRKVLSVPAFEMLKESAPRAGFFEDGQYRAVAKRLPEDRQAAVAIAYTFGWGVRSEVLTLERRQLDLKAWTVMRDGVRMHIGPYGFGRQMVMMPFDHPFSASVPTTIPTPQILESSGWTNPRRS